MLCTPPTTVKDILHALSPTLQQLDHFNRSSPDFHDQLSNVLCGKEYKKCVRSLQGKNLV